MAKITGILCQIITGKVSGAGTDGSQKRAGRPLSTEYSFLIPTSPTNTPCGTRPSFFQPHRLNFCRAGALAKEDHFVDLNARPGRIFDAPSLMLLSAIVFFERFRH
jgi:hypothetical protein